MTYYTKTLLVVIVLLTIYLLFTSLNTKNMENQNLVITSSAFSENASIPAKYTCDGDNINPPWEIAGIDENSKSLVLIMDDPDVPRSLRRDGMWDHWVKFNIPVSGSKFVVEEGVEPAGVSGIGTSGNLGYYGPCPPDKKHRYFFKVYALDTMLNLPEGSTKKEVEDAMDGHILQRGELVGLYDRS